MEAVLEMSKINSFEQPVEIKEESVTNENAENAV